VTPYRQAAERTDDFDAHLAAIRVEYTRRCRVLSRALPLSETLTVIALSTFANPILWATVVTIVSALTP
jgi:hypothetical protein